MRYPVAIEQGTDDTAFGVVVPDLPGCFSAGDTLDGAQTPKASSLDTFAEEAGETRSGTIALLTLHGCASPTKVAQTTGVSRIR
jgi:hypothetical protein